MALLAIQLETEIPRKTLRRSRKSRRQKRILRNPRLKEWPSRGQKVLDLSVVFYFLSHEVQTTVPPVVFVLRTEHNERKNHSHIHDTQGRRRRDVPSVGLSDCKWCYTKWSWNLAKVEDENGTNLSINIEKSKFMIEIGMLYLRNHVLDGLRQHENL